jgi:PAS domain S-box-containing protein
MIVTVLALAAALAALEFVELRRGMGQAREQARGDALAVTSALAQGVGGFLADLDHVLTELASNPEVRPLDPTLCSEPMVRVLPYLRYAVNILAVDLNGEVRCSGDGEISAMASTPALRYDDRDWFQAVQARDALFASGPLRGRYSGRWVSVVARPILGADGEFLGAVAITVDLDRFQGFLAGAGTPQNTLLTLADGGVHILARSAPGSVGIGDTLPHDNPEVDIFQPGGGSLVTEDADGVERVFAWHQIPGSTWVIFAGTPTDAVLGPAFAALRRDVFWALLITGLLLALVTWTYGTVTRSLSRLVQGTRAAALGDPSRVPMEGPREVVEVGRQFKQTLEARAEAERDARAAELRWHSVTENAAFGVAVVDGDGDIVESNPALVTLLEEPSGDLGGAPFVEIFWDEDRGRVILDGLLEGDRLLAAEERFRTREGNLRTVRLTGRRAEAPEGGFRLEVFAEDITAQEDLKVQLLQSQKMEAVGRLAGGVAHDFNNLLTVIQGHAEIMLAAAETPIPRRRNAKEIVQAAERASNLTNQLLAFSRHGGIESPTDVDLNQLVRGMERMCRRLIGEHIRMHLELQPIPPVTIDPTRFEQVVLNLVVNARDAMPEGGVLTLSTTFREHGSTAIATRADEEPANTGWVILSVQDTGSGIAPEVRERIFDPFFTTKAPGQGSGLGLSTVYGIVSSAGGEIGIDSAPGQGTVFRVGLPPARSGTATEPAAGAQPTLPSSPDSGTILVVEDEQQVREIIVSVLGEVGFNTIEARDGKEGLELVRSRGDELDLVVTDVIMPRLQGPEMVAEFRDQFPTLPVVFTSGYAEGRIEMEALEEVGDAFLAKPFRPTVLLEVVREALRSRQELETRS